MLLTLYIFHQKSFLYPQALSHWAQKDSLHGILGVDEFVHIRKCLQEWALSLQLCYNVFIGI